MLLMGKGRCREMQTDGIKVRHFQKITTQNCNPRLAFCGCRHHPVKPFEASKAALNGQNQEGETENYPACVLRDASHIARVKARSLHGERPEDAAQKKQSNSRSSQGSLMNNNPNAGDEVYDVFHAIKIRAATNYRIRGSKGATTHESPIRDKTAKMM